MRLLNIFSRESVVAELKTNALHKKSFMLTSSIVLSDPSLFRKQWQINGKIVQRKILSRTPDGRPKVVIIWCPVTAQSRNFVLKTTSLPEPGIFVPRTAPRVRATFVIGDKQFVAFYDGNKAKKMRSGPYSVTYRSFMQLENGLDKILGAHFYVTHYGQNCVEISVRISNATLDGPSGTGFCGQVFFNDAFISINGERHNLVNAPGNHLIMPMQQTHRRYTFGFAPEYCRAVSGNCFHDVGGYGAEMQKLPKFTADYQYAGNTGWGAIAAKQSNEYNNLKACMDSGIQTDSIEMRSPKMGLFHPYYLADSGSGAPGGWGIQQCSGLGQSSTNIELLKLQHKGMMDRHSVVCFDKTGEYISGLDFASGNAGVQPFYHNIIGGWKVDWASGGPVFVNEQLDAPPFLRANMGKPWNSGTCSYLGAKYMGGLRDYEYIDDAHYSRNTKFAKGLIYLSGDELAIDDHKHMAEFCLFSWGITPHTLMWSGQGDHSVIKQLEHHKKNPNWGGWISRAFGWSLHTLSDAYVLADDAFREKNKKWFLDVEELFKISAMPSGIWQREAYIGGAYDDGKIPTNQDVAGAIYIGIVSAGILGLVKGVLGRSEILKDVMNRIIPALYNNGPYAPHGQSYWVSVAPKGQPPHSLPKHFSGGLESYNGYWTLMAGYHVGENREHFERIKSYAEPKPTHAARVKELFKDATGWDDKLENAAYYIAEVQSKGLS